MLKKRLAKAKSNKTKKKKYSTPLEFKHVDWEKLEKIFTADRNLILKHLEKEGKKNPQTKEILTLLAGGAVFALSLVIPALPMALAPFIIGDKSYNKGRLNQTIKRLKKQKLVKVVYDDKGQPVVRITRAGRVRALRYKLIDIEVEKPKRWDKKWRIVIFDIPEKYKRVREIFRQHLKTMRFYPLQKSVWAHPYPCFDEIEFLRQVYSVAVDVTYIVAERIEESDELKDYFQLR